jgi:hypothetical protein
MGFDQRAKIRAWPAKTLDLNQEVRAKRQYMEGRLVQQRPHDKEPGEQWAFDLASGYNSLHFWVSHFSAAGNVSQRTVVTLTLCFW